jgi:hypothetical protein
MDEPFLVKRARKRAVESAKFDVESQSIREVWKYQGWRKDDGALQPLKEKIATAQSVDDEWIARWELWSAEYIDKENLVNLKKAEEYCAREYPSKEYPPKDQMLLEELKQLRMELCQRQRDADEVLREEEAMKKGELKPDWNIGLKVNKVNKEVRVYQKAYDAAYADAQRLCPGKSFHLGPGMETSGLDFQERIDSLTALSKSREDYLSAASHWLNQLPAGADQARQLAQEAIDKAKELLEFAARQRDGCTKAIEELPEDQRAGRTFYITAPE